jgi:hypothetical protein
MRTLNSFRHAKRDVLDDRNTRGSENYSVRWPRHAAQHGAAPTQVAPVPQVLEIAMSYRRTH